MTATTIGVGLSNHRDAAASGSDAARAALDRLRGRAAQTPRPDLALLLTSHPDPAQVLKAVNAILDDVPLVGATSAGEYSHEGTTEGGVGVMLIHSETMRLHPIAHQRGWFGRGRMLGDLHGLSEAGLGGRFNNRALVLFPEDRSANLDRVVDQAMTDTAMMYAILGGAGPSIEAPPTRPPAIFYMNRVLKAGFSGAELLSQQALGMALANGWTPVSGPYRVTYSADRRLHTLDGRPAREVYEDFFDMQGLPPDQLDALLLHYPVGICGSGDCKVSIAPAFDRHGALIMSTPPPTNSLVHILSTGPDAMLTAVNRALDQALAMLPTRSPEPQGNSVGALFIDCMSNAMVLNSSDYARQQQAVRDKLGDLPFLGFRSHGVLARLHGQTAGLYECTVGACLLPA